MIPSEQSGVLSDGAASLLHCLYPGVFLDHLHEHEKFGNKASPPLVLFFSHSFMIYRQRDQRMEAVQEAYNSIQKAQD